MGGIIYMAFPFTNPSWLTGAISLSRPQSAIRRDLLRITPVGTSMEDVLKVIEEREWTLRWTSNTYGYFITRGHVNDGATRRQIEDGISVEVGKQSIRIYLGRYRVIFAIDVGVYYAFDEDSRLIDIAIRKEADLC
jgi:hypothetical protein